MIPRSWATLHLPKFAKIPRSTSKREMFWYQSTLVKVVISFCELVRRTEDTVSSNLAKTDTLARRSLYLLVISIINTGTIYPHPAEYGQMWNQVQKACHRPQLTLIDGPCSNTTPKVFGCRSLKAGPFLNLQAERLLQNLVKAFGLYDGKDQLGVIVTDGYSLPNKFAGLSLEAFGIAVTHLGIPKPHKRRPIPPNTKPEIQKINAAYIITLFWRTNGPRFVRRRQCERRQCEHEHAYERLIQRRKPKACQNCCILTEMRYSKDSIY